VARHGSFRKAADELHVTPAAVSQQIKVLEEQFGQPLFHRLATGLVLTRAGQAGLPLVREALTSLEKAAQLQPDRAGWRLNKAIALYLLGRRQEAVDTYETAIKARPEDPNLHYFLGTLYSFGGAQAKAIERYEDAIKYGPDLAYPKNDLAYIYAESGENLCL